MSEPEVFHREHVPDEMKGVVDAILGDLPDNTDFVLIKAVEKPGEIGHLISMISTLDNEQRLQLIIAQLKHDMGPEAWRGFVRQLATTELVDMIVGRGDKN